MAKPKSEHFLTEGPIFQSLMHLALPIMASSFLGTAYSITDMIWIGLLGADPVAGVGAAGMFLWLSQGFAMLPRMGGQVEVAQKFGQHDEAMAEKYATASVRLVVVLGIVYGLFCALFGNTLVGIFNLKEAAALSSGGLYLRITGGLIIFQYVNYVLTGLFTAQGDSRTPLLSNTVGLIFNMVFDPLLILGIGPFPRLEVAGGAIATVTAQVISLIVFLVRQKKFRRRGQRIRLHLPERVRASVYRGILRIGLPSALQSLLYCSISMVITRMVASFGSAAVAVQSVGGNIESLTWNTADGFGSAMNAFTGQNYGAKKFDRIREGYRIAFISTGLWCCFIAFLFLVFPKSITALFFHEPEPVQICIYYLIIVGISEPFLGIEMMSGGAVSGFGETRIVSIISIVFTGLRIPLAWLLVHITPWGLNAIWWALSGTTVVKGILMYLLFRHVYARKSRELPEPA